MGKTELNIAKLFTGIIIILFLIWYLPISYYNVFSYDDFWHGGNVKKYGFWSAQLFYYFNWEGSYEHTFFATIPHTFLFKWLGNRAAFVLNIITLILLIISLNLNIRKFIYKDIPSKKIETLLFSFYVVIVLYTISKTQTETIFWICINFTYLTGIAFILFSIYFFSQPNKLNIFFTICFLILTFGNKISYVMFLLCLLIVLMILKKIKFNRYMRLSLMIITISVILNISAPGNYLRLNENLLDRNIGYKFTILEIAIYKLTNYYLPFLIKSSLLFYPLTLVISDKIIPYRNSYIRYGLLLTIICFLTDSFVFFICFRNPGPIRSNIILECCGLVLGIGISCWLVSNLQDSKIANIIVLVLAFTSFSFIAFKNLKYLPISKEFSAESVKRVVLIKNSCTNSNIKKIMIPSLQNSGLLHNYKANDSTWLNSVFINYFDCNKLINISN